MLIIPRTITLILGGLHIDIGISANKQELTLEEIILLIAVLYSLFDSDMNEFLGLASDGHKSLKLSPLPSLDQDILKKLEGCNALKLSDHKGSKANHLYAPGSLKLVLPDDFTDSTSYLSSLESSMSAVSKPELNPVVIKLCEEISVSECLAFFEYAMNYHQISFKIGKRTRSVIVRGLNSYSVGQLCSLIWSVVKGLVTAKKTRAKSYYHMAKYADLALGRMVDKAITEPWCVTKFHRPSLLPQSQLSSVVLAMLLKSKDDGYGFTLARRETCRLKVGTVDRAATYDPFQKTDDRESLIVFLQDALETGNPRYISDAFHRLAPAIERVTGVRIKRLAGESMGLESFFEVLSLLDLRINVFPANQDNLVSPAQ